MAKSNIDHLKKIISELSVYDAKLGEEAEEFLDAIEEELTDCADEIKSLKEDLSDKDSTIRALEEDSVDNLNEEQLGVDTLYWKLKDGNLIVTEKMENFVKGLKLKYGMLPA